MANSPFISHATDPDAIATRLMTRAHNRDGLPEIAVGGTFLLVSGLSYAQVALPRGSIGFKAAVTAFSVLVPLLILGSPWILKRVRRRYLMARVGYVEAKPMARKQMALGILLALAMAAVALLAVTRWSHPDGWLLAGTGLFGGALAVWCGRAPRFVAGGALMAAAGVSLAIAGVALEAGFAILFGCMGLASLVSGSIVFLRLMR